MQRQTTFLPAFAVGVAVAMSVASPSLAFPITYTEQATATGCLGGTTQANCLASHAFTDAAVLLTMTSDTNNVINPVTGIFENVTTALVKATVSVSGAAAVMFNDSIAVFANQTLSPANVGFADLTRSLDILDTESTSFVTYDLKSFIGPITGSPAHSSLNQTFLTASGDFILTGISDLSSTFTAMTPVTAPEPSSLTLLAAAFAALGVIRRRKIS
jgi:hypothetical protein